MEQTRTVYEAWRVLDAIDGLDAPDVVVRERREEAIAALMAALQEAAERFVRIRLENSPAR